MKKVAFFIVTLLLAVRVIAQAAEPATYTTAINKFKQYYNHDQIDSIFSMFSPEMKAALPLDNFKTTTGQLKSQYGNLINAGFVKYGQSLAVYKATFQNNTFLLNLALNSQNKITGLLLSPYKESAAGGVTLDPALTESPILVKTLSGSISGSLVTPKNLTGKIPVVLIIADAGATDRDGNNPKTGINSNTYKMLAYDLGKNGIATLRYDKRLVGESVSSTKEKELHIEDYSDDAVALIGLLNDDQRFSKIIVFGHGEGALVGTLAIPEQPVKAFISAEWAADPAEKILTNQMKAKPQFLIDKFKNILDSLRKGKITDNVDPSLYYIARPSIQPFIMSWCRYDPLRGIKRVKMPILLIQGNTDKVVAAENAERLKKAKSDAKLFMVSNMNHILKEAPADEEQNIATYSKPDLPLKAELIPAIVDFISKVR
ncbi:serine aminopeptidase domain-containing protein [Mucilaginibacter sp.]|uniref:serine aminopeptidase domain-containing protein n=1 Tax=Mucilaginibacter sp. TaxID=1882438 RepID=UPI003D12978E